MKNYIYAPFILMLAGSIITLTSCNPHDFNPEDASPERANSAQVHIDVDPQCSPIVTAVLKDNAGNASIAGMVYGQVEIVNNPENLFVFVKAGTEWQVSQSCFYSGTAQELQALQVINTKEFPNQWSNPPVMNIVTMYEPITNFQSLRKVMINAMLCRVDYDGFPYQFTEVWARGNAFANGWTVDFQPIQCFRPASTAPSTLTAGTCNQCNSENSVTFDPADPTCVDVSSCKDLSNVVLKMSDCSVYKYDNLNGHNGTFCSPSGLDIVTVWVKSGCNQSGDGPGYGRRFDNPSSTVSCP